MNQSQLYNYAISQAILTPECLYIVVPYCFYCISSYGCLVYIVFDLYYMVRRPSEMSY